MADKEKMLSDGTVAPVGAENEMVNLDVEEVSIVGRPAIKRKFLIRKSEGVEVEEVDLDDTSDLTLETFHTMMEEKYELGDVHVEWSVSDWVEDLDVLRQAKEYDRDDLLAIAKEMSAFLADKEVNSEPIALADMTKEDLLSSAIYHVTVASAFEKIEKEDSYKPTASMKAEAKRGLAWRSEYGRGGTAVGIARARDIVNGKNLSASTVKRMFSFFSRHEVDKQAEGFRAGEKGYPSNGKISWCVTGDTDILMADGTNKRIDEIHRDFNRGMEQYVLAYDESDGQLKPRKVTRTYCNPSKRKDFIGLGRSRGESVNGVSNRPYINITKDHEVLTQDGWKRAERVDHTDNMFTVSEGYDSETLSAFLGTFLGDGSFEKTSQVAGRVTFVHGHKQYEYLKEKSRLFNLLPIVDFVQKSGYGEGCTAHRARTHTSPYIAHILKPFHTEDGRRCFPKDVRIEHPAAFLAFLICDDGSLHIDGVKGTTYRLHTEGFDEVSVDNFIAFLDRLGFPSKKYKRENTDGFVIYVSKQDNVRNLSEFIAPYVPISMRYKVLEEHRDIPYRLEVPEHKMFFATPVPVTKHEAAKKANGVTFAQRYDLEVEELHNFVANGYVIHNCLWGGDSGFSWSRRIANRLKKSIEYDVEAVAQIQNALIAVLTLAEASEEEVVQVTKGKTLGTLLSNAISRKAKTRSDRAVVVQQLADAAGITTEAVYMITTGKIKCPPQKRLAAFAKVLNISESSLKSAARNDGCKLSKEEETMNKLFFDAEKQAICAEIVKEDGSIEVQEVQQEGLLDALKKHFTPVQEPEVPSQQVEPKEGGKVEQQQKSEQESDQLRKEIENLSDLIKSLSNDVKSQKEHIEKLEKAAPLSSSDEKEQTEKQKKQHPFKGIL